MSLFHFLLVLFDRRWQAVSVKMVEGKRQAFTLLPSSSSTALVSATAATPYMVGTVTDLVAIVDDLSTLEGSTPVSDFDQIYYACTIIWEFPVDVLDTAEGTKQATFLNVGLRELVVDSHLMASTVKGQDLIDAFAMWHFVERGVWPVQARPELAAFATLKFSKIADGSQDSSSFFPYRMHPSTKVCFFLLHVHLLQLKQFVREM